MDLCNHCMQAKAICVCGAEDISDLLKQMPSVGVPVGNHGSEDALVTTDYEAQRDDTPTEADNTQPTVEVDGQEVTIESLMPTGHPDDWDASEWDEFETWLDTLPFDAACEMEGIAWERMGISGGGSVSDLLDSKAKAVAKACHCQPEKHNNTHLMSCQAHLEGDSPTTHVVSVLKGAPKGAPCLDDCRGPGYAGTSPLQQYETHLPRCPQHPSYDPTKPYSKPSTYVPAKPKCKHDRTKVVDLEGGLSIFATAHRDVKYLQDEGIDIGVYAYSGWQGSFHPFVSAGTDVPWAPERVTQAVILPWPDYKVPEDTSYMPDMVRWMLTNIESGKVLEVACMGGHGRTGTLLAMLLVAQGLSPGEAIRETRKRHCDSAIESKVQCDYIAQFYKDFHGHDVWRKEKRLRKLFNRQVGSKSSGTVSGGSWKGSGGTTTGFGSTKTGATGQPSTTYSPGAVWDRDLKCYVVKSTGGPHTPLTPSKGGVT